MAEGGVDVGCGLWYIVVVGRGRGRGRGCNSVVMFEFHLRMAHVHPTYRSGSGYSESPIMSSRVKLVHAYRAILRELHKAVRIFEILLTLFLTYR